MLDRMKNVLISGGAGFIGSNLALSLIRQGYSVTVLDNLSAQVHGNNIEKSFSYNSIRDKVIFVNGDVRNRKDWEKSLVGQEAVIHLAAVTGTGQSMYEISKYTGVNIGGTALLLDILAQDRREIKKIIVASSRTVYGEGRYWCSVHGEVYPKNRNECDLRNGYYECKCPECKRDVSVLATHEKSESNPTSVYGITKLVQEQLCLVTCKSLDIPVIAFRYQNVYGPGQSLINPHAGILSIFSERIMNNNTINIFEDGKECRDFVYVDDVVDATILGLENEEVSFSVYNVGTGQPIDLLSIARKLVTLYESEVQIKITGDFRRGDIRHNYADLTKINKELNFMPKYSFESGVTEFVKWVRSQEIQRVGEVFL